MKKVTPCTWLIVSIIMFAITITLCIGLIVFCNRIWFFSQYNSFYYFYVAMQVVPIVALCTAAVSTFCFGKRYNCAWSKPLKIVVLFVAIAAFVLSIMYCRNLSFKEYKFISGKIANYEADYFTSTGLNLFVLTLVGLPIGVLVSFATTRRKKEDAVTVSIENPTPTEPVTIEQAATDTIESVPNANVTETATEATKKKPNKKKLLMFSGIGIAVIVALVLIITFAVANHFDTYEKLGLRCVEKYQDMLKDPDSLILRSDVILMHIFNGEDDMSMTEYCFFTASGNNSYGASIVSSPCFVDGKYHSLEYFCDLDDIPNEKELLELDEDEVVKYLQVKLAFYKWQLYGEDADKECEDVWKVTVVDRNKVARKMGIKVK